jgi:hypothetical protein
MKLSFRLSYLCATLMIFACTQGKIINSQSKGPESDAIKLSDEGIPDDRNHPRMIEAMREEIRANRDLAAANDMLKETFFQINYEDNSEDREFAEYGKRHTDWIFDQAMNAWEDFQEKETDLETELFCGEGPGGFPKQDNNARSATLLIRDRIDQIKKILGRIAFEFSEANDDGRKKIEDRITRIEKMQAAWHARKKIYWP